MVEQLAISPSREERPVAVRLKSKLRKRRRRDVITRDLSSATDATWNECAD